MNPTGNPNDFYNQAPPAYNFQMPDQEFSFQTFDNTQTSVPPNYDNYASANQSMGSFYNPNEYVDSSISQNKTTDGNDFDDEPPLLEELGINPQHIFLKTLAVLNPMRGADQQILQDADMAGPLVFCLALGGCLLLSGKVTFSYIYGIGVMGCIAFYCLLSLMAVRAQVTFGAVVSVLGYCLLPMVVLSGINVLITIQGTIGLIVAAIAIIWCAMSASKLFVTAYSMDHQQVLIAYPCALLYGVFALITIF
ncbi:protein YIPF5-like [Teleopsis dalmanni]|uniref:protein YIPF5-like n=1 Tax=Teleopsis dalmanni TaxID=139649 RepID=UPI0018CC8912|nr:protein YIPF5-like [Teleopsis dalmanni]XP_037929696.1 protein YIPF5-like [Teleopsis dalmanni]XP_037933051.1 protein YIPF5-like [Teleopsis dalmanni]XP_037933052.1 protein YIPF5-like [Teleopsis dalmanni]